MNDKRWDKIWVNSCLVTLASGKKYDLIYDAALAIKNGKIAWLGSMSELNGNVEDLATEVCDVQGRCITPGLIDCHTHLVYAGDRSNEFALRLQGKTYAEIAQAGGGIMSTVRATRQASEKNLLEYSLPRAQALMQSGVTTMEIKSGYGLDWDTELKILRVAKKIGEQLPVEVVTTFLGAHTLPVEFSDNAKAYLDLICDEMIPVIAKENLAQGVDVFCEKIAFDLQQTQRVFQAARQYGLAVRCHSEQFSYSGSAALAATYQALSVDHLEHLTEEGVRALAQSGTVAVLLPGAFYFLRETKCPPVDWLRNYQVPIAIASDCNPGTSPVTSLLLMLNMACTLFGLTPEEALLGATCHAAKALGLDKSHGTLQPGKVAHMNVWDVSHPDMLSYYIGMNLLHERIFVHGSAGGFFN